MFCNLNKDIQDNFTKVLLNPPQPLSCLLHSSLETKWPILSLGPSQEPLFVVHLFQSGSNRVHPFLVIFHDVGNIVGLFTT